MLIFKLLLAFYSPASIFQCLNFFQHFISQQVYFQYFNFFQHFNFYLPAGIFQYFNFFQHFNSQWYISVFKLPLTFYIPAGIFQCVNFFWHLISQCLGIFHFSVFKLLLAFYPPVGACLSLLESKKLKYVSSHHSKSFADIMLMLWFQSDAQVIKK